LGEKEHTKQVVIVSGLAGSGKSIAIRTLEDMGYYTIDNLPVSLFKTFLDSLKDHKISYRYIALALDSRDSELSHHFEGFLEGLKDFVDSVSVIYLSSNHNVILKRFKETRRVHPLSLFSKEQSLNLIEAIKCDEKLLEPIKRFATQDIDTSDMSSRYLKQLIKHYFSPSASQAHLTVHLISFGFKYGVPADVDALFDVRCFKNPFYDPLLKAKTGLDKEIKDYVLEDENLCEFVDKVEEMILFLYPLYQKEGKSFFNIGIGCTGGKHRSVVIVHELLKRLEHTLPFVTLEHRHSDKWHVKEEDL
jgi:UPF0042 nucleotide-binding protein